MLRAKWEALKPGGKLAYYVIAAEEPTKTELARLRERDGNEHIATDIPYSQLMVSAGFASIELEDVSDEYRATLLAWIEAWEDDAGAFIELVGEEDYTMRMGRRALDVEHIEDGLLRRYLITARRP